MANKIYVGDIGTAIVLNLGVDLTDAVSPELHVQKPDGSVVTWLGSVYTMNSLRNFVRYVTVKDDLNLPGKYKVQGHVTIGGWTGHSETVTFTVYEEFK